MNYRNKPRRNRSGEGMSDTNSYTAGKNQIVMILYKE